MDKIGIIWDWQLGQFIALEWKDMWVDTFIYWDWWENSPAWQVSRILDADWYNYDSQNIELIVNEKPDAMTIEWENVPVDLLEELKKQWLQTRPNSKALHLIQNRLREKLAINDAWAKTAEFFEVNTLDDLIHAYSDLWKWILKTTTDGYDGKWQIKIYSESDMEVAIEEMKWKQLIYEQLVNFKTEISVIIWRRPNWEMVAFEPTENVHEDWILRTSTTKTNLTAEIIAETKRVAMDIADSMWIEWLLAVEMFVLPNWTIIINEVAPRPHNSGHLTMQSYNKSQYNILIRAILDQPFWDLNLIKHSKMTNFLWDEIRKVPWRIEGWWKKQIIRLWDTWFYDYWKNGIIWKIPKWRKMWHKTEEI